MVLSMMVFDGFVGPNHCSPSPSVGDGEEAVAEPHEARLATWLLRRTPHLGGGGDSVCDSGRESGL